MEASAMEIEERRILEVSKVMYGSHFDDKIFFANYLSVIFKEK